MKPWTCSFIAIFLVVLLPLCGQESRGTILGRIADQSGSVIVGAKVSATNTATGVHYTSTSNGTGDYILPFLIPGDYNMIVESRGFRTSKRAGIAVRESDRVTIDTTSSQQLASNIVTLSSAFSGVRAPRVNNYDLSVIKNTLIRERLCLQFNAEFVNTFNHPQFTPPITTPTSTAFGQLTGSYNWQRIIEFGLKVQF